ncbi:MAG: cytochrome c biogenesis protein CcsA [Actinomycetota bacterium]
MIHNSKRRIKVLLVTFGLVLLAVILAFIAPEEKTLGSYIRLIYIHAAVTWVGLALFAASGLLGVLYFIVFLVQSKSKAEQARDVLIRWSSASQSTAIIFWTASVVLGSFAASLTWGGNWWIEPRLRIAAFILVLALVFYQLRLTIADKRIWAGLNFSLPAVALILLKTTGKLVHPNNAFAKSDSIEIKVFAALITLVFIAVAFNIMRWSVTKLKDDKEQLALASKAR